MLREVYFVCVTEALFSEARMEAEFEKCCGLGTSWALEGLRCEKFTGPVSGVPTVEQGLCLEAVDICCVRAYHEEQCKKGKLDAHAGLACVSDTKSKRSGPGDYHRDCCEACKLGNLHIRIIFWYLCLFIFYLLHYIGGILRIITVKTFSKEKSIFLTMILFFLNFNISHLEMRDYY